MCVCVFLNGDGCNKMHGGTPAPHMDEPAGFERGHLGLAGLPAGARRPEPAVCALRLPSRPAAGIDGGGGVRCFFLEGGGAMGASELFQAASVIRLGEWEGIPPPRQANDHRQMRTSGF